MFQAAATSVGSWTPMFQDENDFQTLAKCEPWCWNMNPNIYPEQNHSVL